MEEKKQSKFKRLMRAVFVRNWDIKLAAIVLGFFCWLLVIIAV